MCLANVAIYALLVLQCWWDLLLHMTRRPCSCFSATLETGNGISWTLSTGFLHKCNRCTGRLHLRSLNISSILASEHSWVVLGVSIH